MFLLGMKDGALADSVGCFILVSLSLIVYRLGVHGVKGLLLADRGVWVGVI